VSLPSCSNAYTFAFLLGMIGGEPALRLQITAASILARLDLCACG
jgi:hypothetical protein